MDNKSYYGVTRTDEYIAHYGIKGMKWGVRKARESGNTKALGRQFKKAQKKLAKLEKRAANGSKYAKRAAALGAGAAAAGGLAALGTGGVSKVLSRGGNIASAGLGKASKGLNKASTAGLAAFNKYANMKIQSGNLSGNAKKVARWQAAQLAASKASVAGRNAAKGMAKAGVAVNKAGASSAIAVDKWGNKKNVIARNLESAGNYNVGLGGSKALRNTVKGAAKRTRGYNQLNMANKVGFTNNQLARAGAAAIGAGLAGAAGYNAYRAATTKRAAKKAAQFRSEMNKAFAGTQYANGGARQGKKRRSRRS